MREYFLPEYAGGWPGGARSGRVGIEIAEVWEIAEDGKGRIVRRLPGDSHRTASRDPLCRPYDAPFANERCRCAR